jgi:hypothetical protein
MADMLDYEAVAMLDYRESSRTEEAVAGDERRNFFDIADLSADMAFLPASPPTGMVEALEAQVAVGVVGLKLAGWEDRNELIVVIGSEASAPAADAAVARCQ